MNLRRTLPILAALLLATVPVAAGPCVAVRPENQVLTRDGDQRAFCYFRDGWQDLIVQLAFTGDVRDFGIILALPSIPEFRKVDSPFFDELRELTRSQGGFKGGALPEGNADRSAESGAPPAVEVIKDQIVGAYQAVTLRARAIDALTGWLDEHGYIYPPGTESILREFVEREWYFVAVRVVREDQAREFDGRLQPMGMRFRTEVPLIATRFASLVPEGFSINTYFVTESPIFVGEYTSTYETGLPSGGWDRTGRGLNARFPLTRVYSAPLTRDQLARFPTLRKILDEDVQEGRASGGSPDRLYEGLHLTRLMGFVDQEVLARDLTVAPEVAWDSISARQIVRSLGRHLASDQEVGQKKAIAALTASVDRLEAEDVVLELEEALVSDDFRLRRRSADLLGRFGGKLAVPPLVEALEAESDGFVKRTIRDALERITGERHMLHRADLYRQWWERNR